VAQDEEPGPKPEKRKWRDSMSSLIGAAIACAIFFGPTAFGVYKWFEHHMNATKQTQVTKERAYLSDAHMYLPDADDANLVAVGARLCVDIETNDTTDAVEAYGTLGLTDLGGKDSTAGVGLMNAAVRWICPEASSSH
jgi:hypothetical protein